MGQSRARSRKWSLTGKMLKVRQAVRMVGTKTDVLIRFY